MGISRSEADRVRVSRGARAPIGVMIDGRWERVLRVERIQVRGFRRLFLVRTRLGVCEVLLDEASGRFRLRKWPRGAARLWALVCASPRFSLASSRRRRRKSTPVEQGALPGRGPAALSGRPVVGAVPVRTAA